MPDSTIPARLAVMHYGQAPRPAPVANPAQAPRLAPPGVVVVNPNNRGQLGARNVLEVDMGPLD